MARSASVNTDQVHELLLQALETERGGIQIYTAALKAAVNDDLKKEWSEYLEETRTHEQVLTRVFEQLELDTEATSPGREVVAHLGASLVKAIARRSAGYATVGEIALAVLESSGEITFVRRKERDASDGQ